jgi:hypothetical protein
MGAKLLQDAPIVNNRKEVFRVSLFHAAIAGFRDPDQNNPSGDKRRVSDAANGFTALRSDNGRAVQPGGPSHFRKHRSPLRHCERQRSNDAV